MMDIWEQLASTFFNWEAMAEVIPNMVTIGLPNTLYIASVSAIFSTFLGLILSLMGVSRIFFIRLIARIYIDIFRGIPAVVTILLVGLGLGPIVRELTNSTDPRPLGILALTLMCSAYVGEIFRSGIQSVDKGQLEASLALGFSHKQSMRLVVVPQGITRVLPALVNQYIVLIKESSLIYFLGVLATQRDIFRVANDQAANTGNLSPLIAAALMYLILTVPLTHLVNYIDSRMRNGKMPVHEDIPTSSSLSAAKV